MKDGFELHPPASGGRVFLCKNVFAVRPLKPIFAVLKNKGFGGLWPTKPWRSWPVRLRARTAPFHGGDTSSNLVRATKPCTKMRGFFYCDALRTCSHEHSEKKPGRDKVPAIIARLKQFITCPNKIHF